MRKQELNEKIAEVSKTIFSFCMARTRTREDAEDLAQDILLAIMKSAENIRDDAAFYGFMWSVAGNVYKAWYRKKLKNTDVELDETMEKSLPDDTDDFDALFEEESDLYLLRRELSLLSKKYRDATILYYIENRSCDDIAKHLSISESMVKYLLFKSRKILKEGFTMERKLGKLSYHPKTLYPMYSGTGPNRFYDFLNKKIRQNIVAACYNDLLTPEQISLETGIPLPYLDEEIEALEEKEILLREGARYRTNIVIITADCMEEVRRNAVATHKAIAEKAKAFVECHLTAFRKIGFVGADFSENTLRWQLSTLLNREILYLGTEKYEKPKTAWGDYAHIWCVEQPTDAKSSAKSSFAYSGMRSKQGDTLLFLDYLPAKKGDHHDFFGNERYINILCDIARGENKIFSEYDLEAIAMMIQKGYVVKDGEGFKATLPVYTAGQYEKATAMARDFVKKEILPIVKKLDAETETIMREHTPRHLHAKLPAIAAIAAMNRIEHAVSAPTDILAEEGFLSTAYHPLEMPTCFIVQNN